VWHEYISVSTLEEAKQILAERREEARVVAGATDLILELERGVRRGVETLVDITRVPGLAEIALDGAGWLHLGPLVTHNHCAGSKLVVEHALPLAQACWEVGAPQIRNRGTVAGNLITASPANDTISPLMALEAVVTLASARNPQGRQVPLRDFYTGVRRTVLEPDELLTDIAFPALRPGARGTFVKLALRRAQAISVINVTAIVDFDPANGQTIKAARLTLGAVAPTIIHAAEAEAYLAGQTLTPEVMAQASALTAAAASPIDDVRAHGDYRREMVGVITQRALRALAAGQARGRLPENPVMLWGPQAARALAPLEKMVAHREGTPIVARVNGREYTFTGAGEKTLLRLLREDAGLMGTKEGCAEGECGACTVFVDGAAVMSCLVPAPRAHGAQIVTVEGLARGNELHPIQQGFIDEGAVQCGYCTPGFLMSGAKLLEERPRPNRDEITQALTGNLCRCTGYYKIVAAVEAAARAANR
jgi:xanthine dehydrogenase iron-sulfur cluster and FAD-binding subunit A